MNQTSSARGAVLRQGNEVYGSVFDTSGALLDTGPGIRIFLYLTERSFDGHVWQAIEAKGRGLKAVLRRSVAVRVVEDVYEVVLSAAEAKALVAGDPDVLRRVQLQTETVKLEALRAAHLDRQVQARRELKRLPQRIADLRARVDAIAADVAFRDAHSSASQHHRFAITIDGQTFRDRLEAAPSFASAIIGVIDTPDDSRLSGSVATYRGFNVGVRRQWPRRGPH